MDEKKALQRHCNLLGGTLLVYKVIMNVSVIAFMLLSAVVMAVLAVMGAAFDSATNDGMPMDPTALGEGIAELMMGSMGWGYLLAVAIGLVILLIWKKPSYLKTILTQRYKPMRFGTFLFLLCLTMAIQVAVQLITSLAEIVYNQFGFSMMGVLENSGVSMDSFSMLLYAGILGPIAEEILFRGVLLRTLQPHGKGIAIWVSAILFGFFHGTPIQTPFAVLMGLLLGYVAVEHNIVWAMVLHVFNNLVLGDTLPCLLSLLPNEHQGMVMSALMIGATVAAAFVIWVRRKKIPAVLESFQSRDAQWRAVIGSPCIIIVVVMSLFDMALTMAMLFFSGT